MLKGIIVLEDTQIKFDTDCEMNVTYTVRDLLSGECETLTVPQKKFFNALAIAVHNDGMPDYRMDYDEAEEIQPKNGSLRWIP